jgi:hypothetical protein
MHEPEEHPAVRAALDLLESVAENPMLMASHRVAAPSGVEAAARYRGRG